VGRLGAHRKHLTAGKIAKELCMPFLVIVILVIAVIVARKIYRSKKEEIFYQPNRFDCVGDTPDDVLTKVEKIVNSAISRNGGPDDFHSGIKDTTKLIEFHGDIQRLAYVYRSSNGDKWVMVYEFWRSISLPDGSRGNKGKIKFGIYPKDTLASWKASAEKEVKTEIGEWLSSHNIQFKLD
jgi:hypothetical protein